MRKLIINEVPFAFKIGNANQVLIIACPDVTLTQRERAEGIRKIIPSRGELNCCVCGKEKSPSNGLPTGVAFDVKGVQFVFITCDGCLKDLMDFFVNAFFMTGPYLDYIYLRYQQYLATVNEEHMQ